MADEETADDAVDDVTPAAGVSSATEIVADSSEPPVAAVGALALSSPPAASSPSCGGEALAKQQAAYNKRLSRAKAATAKRLSVGSASASASDDKPTSQFNLDLSALPDKESVAQGEHDLGGAKGGDVKTMVTPRATTDVAITVRGAPKHRHEQLFKVGPEHLGAGKFKFAWRPGGDMIATASSKSGVLVLHLFRRDGSIYNQHTLTKGACLWMEWECKGGSLGILQEGVGIVLWDMPAPGSAELTAPISLCPSITIRSTFCKWSKIASQLAIGTQEGKVIIFNKGQAVMQLHERKGKHGAPVTCGDWLFDNRLGLASGQRVKISQPIAESGSKWESYSKFRLNGWLSKVPRHIRAAGAPNRLAFTLGYPPFVAVSVGDKYLLTFDTTRSHEDLGLTFPEDYGAIAGFRWMAGNVLLVGLTNGYIVTVDFGALIKMQQSNKLPDRVSAMGTTKVFNEYLQDICTHVSAGSNPKIACCGDCAVKIVHRNGVELEVHAEVPLDRKPTIGEYLEKVEWDDQAQAFACSSTDGYLYVHQLLS